jgi:PAS domain S-box-containing protein
MPDGLVEVLWQDSERLVFRTKTDAADGTSKAVLVVRPAAEHPALDLLNRLTHEFELKDELDGAWAVRPLALVHEHGQTVLMLDGCEGEPLDRLIGSPVELGRYLRLAAGLLAAVGQLHERGLIHKDVKPSNILVSSVTGQVWLTGFGIASRLPRERQSPEPPEFLEGTLAYMAPEQTGRMNRSIDSRSDLYSVGVTLYQLLTGSLPFTASDPMEWVHCHIARKARTPNELLKNVPAPVSAIVMKLLAKTAEERYQTAAGAERDLRRCLADWETQGRIDEFALGQHDRPDRLLIPEKLYGREHEIETLLASFDRVVTTGSPELVLVSGYSGIGKSSVVNELHKVLVPPRGLFASGKFDQYKRDIPYATLAQALQSLVRPLLSRSEAQLSVWRDAFREALGPNGLLILDLVPELKFIIGEQPPVPVLPPQDAQRRFQLVFRRFISVFARPEHPLALFLDDLQWLDAATLDLLEDLLTHPDVRHLMLIGAYRDNEVDPSHSLMRKLKAIRAAGAAIDQIVLSALAHKHLQQLIGDSLRCEPETAAPLARLLHEKTAGNPFFSIQFLSSLAEERLLNFDHRAARWSWDIKRIHAKGYTDNVVDLMVGKLSRLPIETQKALQQLACLGNSADFGLLSMVYGAAKDEIHNDLREAVRVGLVLHSERAYRFLHDRVQEAAYSLIPQHSRAEAHLRIGRLLTARIAPEKREEAIFEIVNQFNRGAPLIASQEEREQLAELNLVAGERAKASTAYTSALNYLTAGAEMLGADAWERRHALAFALELHRAECEYLTGQSADAENRLLALSSRAANTIELATVTCLLADLYSILDQTQRAVAVCLDYLRSVGIDWPSHPTQEAVRGEYEQIWSRLGSREIEELIDLPTMSDKESLATLDVLTKAVSPAYFNDENLSSLVICRVVNLSLDRGNSDGSCVGYVWLGIIAGPRFGDYRKGYQFGRLGYALVETRGFRRYQARTYLSFGNIVIPWTMHVRAGRDLVRRAFAAANEIGDLTFASYSCNHLITNLLATGDPLADVQREAENCLEFVRKVRYGLVIDDISAQLALIRTLRGLTPNFGVFDDEHFNEARFERHLADDPVVVEAECWYSIRKLQARFFAGDYASAVTASVIAQRGLWTSPSQFERAEFHFYSALARAALWNTAVADQRRKHFEALTEHHRQIEIWASNCPQNFENRAALVGAEIARIEGRVVDAEHLYEQAIRSARANGFVHNEGLANELAARFYATRRFDTIAHAYLREARYAYVRWGASGKVQQLDELYPHLSEQRSVSAPTSTTGTSVEHLDLTTVIEVSQAVASETVLEKLLETLMRTALEQAGAERGLLILPRGNEYRIEAEATTDSETVAVAQRQANVTAADMPESVLNFVVRAKEEVLLHDASGDTSFSADEYIRRHHARSILCLPLLKQTRLVGVLYLENNLAFHVFTPARMTVLRLLASEAAISLENVRLYGDLQARETKIRRLVDSNIIGIFIWGADGRFIDANDAFLRIIGYDREDFRSGRLRWTDLTPSEWRDVTEQSWTELEATGTAQPYEKEYLRKDGSRVPVLVGRAMFEGTRDEGVGFVIDLTDRKRAEQAIRESERRLSQVQMELAHANRVATMGQLSASIAHEINQPIASAVINANVALNFLRAQPPNYEEAQAALNAIVDNGIRAGNVIDRIRALVKKAPPRKDSLDINEAVLEVLALAQGEMANNRISVDTQLANSLPVVQGDRVQLQQVLLNLFVNAIEAMGGMSKGPRELLISTERIDTGKVLVSVRDSGPGLASESVEDLFEAFYTTKPNGLGMGLSICRSIIEAHQGRLWATSNMPRGAAFQFTLPVYSDNADVDS